MDNEEIKLEETPVEDTEVVEEVEEDSTEEETNYGGEFHEKDYGKVLGKMLNNKVDTAYAMLNSGIDFVIPQYIQDAIKWLNE